MFKISSKHFLTGEELTAQELLDLLALAQKLKGERDKGILKNPLAGKHLALLFEKPSLRTRLSFSIAMQELGGFVVESSAATSKKEEPEDVARVLGGYVHAVMLRTHSQDSLTRMSKHSPIPIINGLSNSHHPCQVLADLLTLKQVFKIPDGQDFKDLEVAYIGDGNNMLHSLLLLLPFLGVRLRYACPRGFQPNALILKKARARAKEGGGKITVFTTPVEAVRGANAIYTDVWTSMGFEQAQKEREKEFDGFQVNEALYSHGAPGAVIMHCLPMVRGSEITDAMAEHPHAVLFQQSENRLHAQKALLLGLLSPP